VTRPDNMKLSLRRSLRILVVQVPTRCKAQSRSLDLVSSKLTDSRKSTPETHKKGSQYV
jgi:hypothetical protein